jgi:hypothetical protein
METGKQLNKIVKKAIKKAGRDLTNRCAVPFGMVLRRNGDLDPVHTFKNPETRNGKSQQMMVEELKQALDEKIQNYKSVIMYGLVYYGKAQINNQGDQATAVILNIETASGDDIPLQIFPYHRTETNEIKFLENYQMKKKSGKFYS